jgi:hypothetical protein
MSFDQLNDISTPIRGGAPALVDTALPVGTRALWVGVGGDIEVTSRLGSTFVLKNVSDGTLLPIHAMQLGALTTADEIIALF